MGTFWRGGWSKVEYSPNSDMSAATEIPNVMKDQTGVKFSTLVETLANENEAPAGKKAEIVIVSSDLTAGTYTALVAAEAALTPQYFRFKGLNAAQTIVVGPAIPRVEFEPNAGGKFFARKVTAIGYGVNEAGIATVTP